MNQPNETMTNCRTLARLAAITIPPASEWIP